MTLKEEQEEYKREVNGAFLLAFLSDDVRHMPDLFLLCHNFTDRRFNLTRGLSSLCTQFFLSSLSQELSWTHVKEALWDSSLANLNCQYHYYSCSLGSLSTIKVTRTQGLWTQLIFSATVTTRWTWRTEGDDALRGQVGRFHRAAQRGTWFKTYELFISGSFHLIFSDHGGPVISETTEM